jgi:hypothetical protein
VKGFWKKAEKIALFLLIAVIPTQIGRHFWPSWSLVAGVRVDYLSVVLYGVDLLWLGLVVTTQLQITNYELRIKKWLNFQNLMVLGFMVVNILVAENKGVAIYSWLRIFQWAWFFKYCFDNKIEVKKILGIVIPWWIIGESALGLAQMIKGGSLNGLMYWLGERRFSFSTMGVAQISVWGQGLVRSYGTFSHPNSLAGFMMVSLGLWMMYFNNFKFQISNFKLNKVWWWVVIWAGVLGVILSGSRTIWLLTLIMMVASFVGIFKGKAGIKKIVGYMAIVLGLFLLVLSLVGVNYRTIDFLGGWDSDSLAKRVSLNTAAVKMWRENLMIGIGAGNFIPRLPEYQTDNQFYWFQPVHNIILLTGTEVGILGLLLILKFLISNTKFPIKKEKWWLLALIFLSGMVDHYWITLPQNAWLLAIVLGVF